jgi:hypothetical protein
MKIRTPKFVMNTVSKIISKRVSEELGFDIYFKLNALEIDTKGLKYRVHNDCELEIDKKDLKNYIKSSIRG